MYIQLGNLGIAALIQLGYLRITSVDPSKGPRDCLDQATPEWFDLSSGPTYSQNFDPF